MSNVSRGMEKFALRNKTKKIYIYSCVLCCILWNCKKKQTKKRILNIKKKGVIMLDHLVLDNNFDDLIIFYFLDYNFLLIELLLDLDLHHQPQLIDQDDLLSKIKLYLIKKKKRIILPILVVTFQIHYEHYVVDLYMLVHHHHFYPTNYSLLPNAKN